MRAPRLSFLVSRFFCLHRAGVRHRLRTASRKIIIISTCGAFLDCLVTTPLASVESVRDVKIRVDTVFIERWHTQTVPTPPPLGDSVGATKFYKDCTKGFWVLLILFLGSFAFRILKAIYLKR